MKKDILQSILTDDLSKARRLLGRNADDLEVLKSLLDQVKDTAPKPLQDIETSMPRLVSTSVSYTCGVGCKMCNAGFSDKTDLFENYKYLSPEQFEALKPWLENSSHVVFVGLGETLDSPHIEMYLNEVRNKISFLTTSGVPINREKIKMLIRSGLKYINYSYDGISTMGHGGGSAAYSRKFWEKIALVEEVKQEQGSHLPEQILTLALNAENRSQLDEIIKTGAKLGIRKVMLIPMTPPEKEFIKETIYPDYDEHMEQINSCMDRWNDKGMFVRFYEHKQSYAETPLCFFMNKHIIFELDRNRPDICCGPLRPPLDLEGIEPYKYWNSFPLRYLRYLQFYKEDEKLPAECDECWILTPKPYGEGLDARYSAPPRHVEFIELFQKASELKKVGQFEKAKAHFKKIADESTELPLKGKAWFHIGEIQIIQKQYPKAQESLSQAVHFCFDHQMAFAYLYLLYSINETAPAGKALRHPYHEFLDFFEEMDEPLATGNPYSSG